MDYDGLPKWQQKLYAGLVIVGGAIFLTYLGYVLYYDSQLEKNSRITKGVVAERQVRKLTKVYLLCKFNIGTETYTSSVKVNEFERMNNCTFEAGDSVLIYYYPSKPEFCKVDLDSSYSRWKKKYKDN